MDRSNSRVMTEKVAGSCWFLRVLLRLYFEVFLHSIVLPLKGFLDPLDILLAFPREGF